MALELVETHLMQSMILSIRFHVLLVVRIVLFIFETAFDCIEHLLLLISYLFVVLPVLYCIDFTVTLVTGGTNLLLTGFFWGPTRIYCGPVAVCNLHE